MAWAAGVLHANAVDMDSGGSAGIDIFYDRTFLTTVKHTLRLAPLGQKRDLPKSKGDIIQFFRWNEIATSLSGSFLTDGTNPDPTQLTGQNIQAQIEEWGGFSQHSRLVEDVHIDRNLEGTAKLWGDNAGNIVDLLSHVGVCTSGAYPVRADGETGDGTYTFEGTVDSATSTTVVDTDISANSNFGDANDDLNQSIIVIMTGTGYGQSRPITDYVTSGGTITVTPAWDITPAAGDTFHVVSAHGLTSSDILTTVNIRAAVTRLKNNRATPMMGKDYVGIISPDTEAELMADTNWLTVMQYKDRPDIVNTGGLFQGEVGYWGGTRWVNTTQPFRFPITTVGTSGSSYGVGPFVPGTSYTNYSATGGVYANLIVGREAFGVTTLKGNNYMSPGIIRKRSGQSDTSNPLNRFSTIGWYLPFVAKGLNPHFAVQLWTGGAVA